MSALDISRLYLREVDDYLAQGQARLEALPFVRERKRPGPRRSAVPLPETVRKALQRALDRAVAFGAADGILAARAAQGACLWGWERRRAEYLARARSVHGRRLWD